MVDWEILGIEPTTDSKEIKRAYAKKLKKYHPEDDPEGYQRLREAFDQARDYVKFINKTGNSVPDTPSLDTTSGETTIDIPEVAESVSQDTYSNYENISDLIFTHDIEANQSSAQQDVDSFLAEVEELYTNYTLRIDRSNWSQLLTADIIWDMKVHDILTYRMTDFLAENYLLPKDIWLLLEQHFNWKEMHPSFFHTYIIECPNFSFQTLMDIPDIDRDTFLFHRYSFFKKLLVNALDESEIHMKNAMALFGEDPDLLKLQVEFFRRKENSKGGLEALNSYLQLEPDDFDMTLQKAELFNDINKTNDAKVICEQLLVKEPENLHVMRLLGICLYKQKEMKHARKMFKHIIKINPLDIVAQTYLPTTTAKLFKDDLNTKVKQEMKTEMGIIPLKEKYQMGKSRIPKIRFIIIAFLVTIGLHGVIVDDFKLYTGVGPINYIKQSIQHTEWTYVENFEEFLEPDLSNNVISLSIENTFHTGYYLTQSRNGELEIGFVSIDGQWESVPVEELNAKLKDDSALRGEIPKDLVANKIVNAINIKDPNSSILFLPIELYVKLFMLGGLYCFFIWKIIREMRALRY